MLLRLARALDIPIRERNQLLLAAGYAPLYREAGLDSEEATQVRAAVGRMLQVHEPYPAVVMDRHWNVVTTNSAAGALFGWLLGDREREQSPNVIRLMFDPDGLRPFVRNWEDVAEALIRRVHREAVGGFPTPRQSPCSSRRSAIRASRRSGAPLTSGPRRCRWCRSSSGRAIRRRHRRTRVDGDVTRWLLFSRR
jgi:PAS domain-containing protein